MFSCREAQAVAGYQGFAGFGSFGSPDVRPNVNYVMTGDVLRIQLIIPSSLSMNTTGFKTALAADGHLRVVAFDDSQVSVFKYWGGSLLSLDVQALNDFASLNDVLTYAAGFAQGSGLNVDLAHSNITFVSKAEQTEGTVVNALPGPDYPANNPLPGPGVDLGVQLETAMSGLLASPMMLLAIAGLGVVGLIVLTKK